MFWRHLNLNFWVPGNEIYGDNDNKIVENSKRKYYERALYFVLDFSKLIHRLLVNYNTTESKISKSVVSVFSQPRDYNLDYLEIIPMQCYTCNKLYYT